MLQRYLTFLGLVVCFACFGSFTLAAIPEIPRVLPPTGIEIPKEKREVLQLGLKDVQEKLRTWQERPVRRATSESGADVHIFTKALDLALRYGEFYGPKDVDKAENILKLARERLEQLTAGKTPWTEAKGLVVRGFHSQVDGSAQPYGLVIPEKLPAGKVPLYIFLHGRGDKQTDLHFIDERLKSKGQVTPSNAIVLHPFGRQCVGYKSAGETDVLEAVEHVIANYPVDRERIVMMGFSMGGAGAWHLGAHYASRWAVVAPGAGFAETAKYTKTDPANVPSYERDLWGCYDVPAYVTNLFNVRTIAYSGENDKQIQAARVMEEAFAAEGRKLDHRIGPGVEHKFEPKTLEKLLADIGAEVSPAKPHKFPESAYWQSRTLRYAEVAGGQFTVLGLEQHWVDARLTFEKGAVKTQNVSALRLNGFTGAITIDGQSVPSLKKGSTSFIKQAGKWTAGEYPLASELWKSPGLQGPIDDAFLEPFLVVEPTGKSSSAKFTEWQQFETEHFIDRWRGLMRGEVRRKKDTEVTAADVQRYHLILWGDHESNSVIARLADRLPVKFRDKSFDFAGKSYEREQFAPAFIYPNPESPRKYVVVNSGLTFREAHDKTNSQQNPKLPDWAVIGLAQSPSAAAAGAIAAAGFFDEQWRVK